MRAALAGSLSLLALLSTTAAAETWAPKPTVIKESYSPPPAEAGGGSISNIIFVNSCRPGGCTITLGNDNALTDESSIPNGASGQQFTLSAFVHGDAVWAQLMQCLREVYAPYDVVVTDEDPGDVPHHMAIASGLPSQIGWSGVGGVAVGTGCDPRNNVVSFSFLNDYPASQVVEMCATVAQESAHSFGLPDHIFDCSDPMTYLGPRCGQKFFRNRLMPCGEFQQSACSCGGARANTHVQLEGVFGPGAPPTPPVIEGILYPADGATLTNLSIVQVRAVDPRGVFKVEILLNGWLWATWQQPEMLVDAVPAELAITIPNADSVPAGVIDVEVRVYNDLMAMSSETVTVTKGSPCSSADSCADGQTCEEGRCAWAQPTGQLGDACEFDQQCEGPNVYDGRCESDGTQSICTRSCYVGVNDNCPAEEGYYCLGENDGDQGVCWLREETGCCSTGADRGGVPLAPLALAGVVGLLAVRRRRRR
jgi:MYXO-CTERM domain-containing protein